MIGAGLGRGLAAAALALMVAAVFGGRAAPSPKPLRIDIPGSRTAGSVPVDVELVLAVDISYSMDPDELTLQREGYVEAIRSPEFLAALKNGMHARIAVTYVEWAGVNEQRIVLPWRLIDGDASARAVAAEVGQAPIRRAYRTSISGALRFVTPMFEDNGYTGLRRVIDVSGDGTNNQGPPVTEARDEVLAKGIVINGLPIVLKRPNPTTMDIPNLDVYYEDCVIGGPGSFVVPIQDRGKFKEAIRTKLVLEIAGHRPAARVIPARAEAPRVSCTIGERMWQERWGRGGDWR
ncbi:MAG TPA: DUF1194 domain-containing protein [Xanthobacteraceae bacterium]|nr:DUF1194 domain-containing protein [Xanthobacteraceae bacterium]